MPGYRALPIRTEGGGATETRAAEALQKHGDLPTAARLLEAALEASLEITSVIPGWLCGRLAALYRTLGRYDDEVRLLERYRETQGSEEARTRYDARLSKAKAIAHKKRRSDSTALSSIRGLSTKRRRSAGAPDLDIDPSPRAADAVLARTVFSEDTLAALQAALHLPAEHPDSQTALRDVVSRLCSEARTSGHRAEHLVDAIKAAWRASPSPDGWGDGEWRARYEHALVWCIDVYFGESEPTP
jgi:hypothetical protein